MSPAARRPLGEVGLNAFADEARDLVVESLSSALARDVVLVGLLVVDGERGGVDVGVRHVFISPDREALRHRENRKCGQLRGFSEPVDAAGV